jgi:CO/xanthine dehydrogenase Mo-binding subunit
MRAADDLLDQLRGFAATQFEVSPEDVVLEGGQAHVRGVPNRSRTWDDLMTASHRVELLGQGHFQARPAPDPVTGKPGASAHWHHGVVAAEVAVDIETGRVEVTRLWGGVYAGRIVNPILCDLQVHGCVLMGLGEALFEQMQYADGTLVTNSLAEYNIPSIRDAPIDLQACVLEDTSKLDIHGIGETLVPAGPAVIGCAVADAIGAHFSELPLTPERVLLAVHEHTVGGPVQSA